MTALKCTTTEKHIMMKILWGHIIDTARHIHTDTDTRHTQTQTQIYTHTPTYTDTDTNIYTHTYIYTDTHSLVLAIRTSHSVTLF